MISHYCQCGHVLYDHVTLPRGTRQAFHDGPCTHAECYCIRFRLDRTKTRYETEQERLANHARLDAAP